MLTEPDRSKAADILMTAERERKQATQLSTTWPDITFEDAYAISAEVARRKMEKGAKLIGHKVGLTSKTMQRSSKINEIVDARIQDPRKIFDTISDNGAAAGIVVGGRPVPPLEMDLRWVGGILYQNSEIEV